MRRSFPSSQTLTGSLSSRPTFNLCWPPLCLLIVPSWPFQSCSPVPCPGRGVPPFDLAAKAENLCRYPCQQFLCDLVMICLWCFSHLLAFLNMATVSTVERTILYCSAFKSPGKHHCMQQYSLTPLSHHSGHGDNSKNFPQVSKHASSAP